MARIEEHSNRRKSYHKMRFCIIQTSVDAHNHLSVAAKYRNAVSLQSDLHWALMRERNVLNSVKRNNEKNTVNGWCFG